MHEHLDQIPQLLSQVANISPDSYNNDDLVKCIDLTRLNNDDSEQDIIQLCKKAETPIGHVASVCIKPQFVALAKAQLTHTRIKIATVANFPAGALATEQTCKEIMTAIDEGADEIDIVFPYRDLIRGETKAVAAFLREIKKTCADKTLKIILESGAFNNLTQLHDACLLAISAGADFLKTSTGKYEIGATLDAAAEILLTIKDHSLKDKQPIGFKASGGIRNKQQAIRFAALAEKIMGESYLQPQTFRFGASQLLDNLTASH